MREIRLYGSAGGEAKAFPTPIGLQVITNQDTTPNTSTFINLIQSCHDLMWWHGQAMLVHVFHALCLQVCLVLSNQM
ncbi:MAG: hypothetical protein AYP45_06745 [Candidatus Brocadia carolinensis]|uniref:Uncharacterized protein n=1 Tax=Candidatus Brocadia carolinensis TaxID=1004156 RepID=A0A1V4AUQ5_9BACT|nr:MAG: hypothetical protein AYP45_06745 [Candidatus Brocadia caroliniensis]